MESAAEPTNSAEEQVPARRSICTTIRKNFHWKCFFLTLMIDACLAVILWCQLCQYLGDKFLSPGLTGQNSYTKGPCDQGYNFIPIAFATMLYVVYLMECYHCKTRQELSTKVDVSTIYSNVAAMKEAQPVVWWRAVCYHYIRRTRQVTRYRNGDAITTTQVYYERMNSHTAGSVFLYHDCGVKDISKRLVGLDKFPVTKIRFTKGFVFANLQAANEFEEQRAHFFQENEQRDDYMEVREGLDLLNAPFKDFVIAFADPNRRPLYTTSVAFWIASFFLLSWFLRILIEYTTAYAHFQVTKLFGTNYLSPTSNNYTGPLSRANTMGSRDLEAALQNNFFIVPSYSEALLMDPVASRTQVVQDRQGNFHVHSRHRWHGSGSVHTLCNEGVIPNYGALIREGVPLVVERTRRSRSMSFLRPRANSQARQPLRDTFRSFSFGNLVLLNRGAYQTLSVTPEGSERLPEEPPPPYEMAMQMCRPLYDKIKRSVTSLDAKFRFGSDKGASSRDDTPL